MTVMIRPKSLPAHRTGCHCTDCANRRHGHDKIGCGCAKCRRSASSSATEVDHETTSPGGTTPKIASCDPRRHAFRKMNVVRWVNRRTPCRRNIGAGIDLAILSRARTRIPLRSAQWLIEEAKSRQPDKTHWSHRLPRSHLDSLVDLTIELFIQQKPGMTAGQIRASFKAYLGNRHTTELGTSCDRGFFLFFVERGSAMGKALIERNFDLARFGVDLDRLYQRANVTPSKTRSCAGKTDELPARFFLLAYITLPDGIEAKLRVPLPVVPKGRFGNPYFIERIEAVPFKGVDGSSSKYDELLCLRDLFADYYRGKKMDDLYYRFRRVQNFGVKKARSGHAVQFFEKRCKPEASKEKIEACLLALHRDIERNTGLLANAIKSWAGDASNAWEMPECTYARDMIARSNKRKLRSIYNCFRDHLANPLAKMCRIP